MGKINFVLRKFLGREQVKDTDNYPDLMVDTAFPVERSPVSTLLIEAIDEPGMLARITRIISEEKANIAKVSLSSNSRGEYGTLMFLLEDCDKSCIQKICSRLKRELKNKIAKVSYSSSREAYVFMKYHMLKFINKPSIILTIDAFGEMLNEIYSNLNYSNAVNLLRRMGIGLGRAIYQYYVSSVLKHEENWFEEVRRALKYLADFYKAFGLGDMVIEEIGGIRYRVYIRENYECLSMKKYSVKYKKTGYFTAGVLAGYFSNLLGRRVRVNEVKCLVNGGDKCVFEIEIYEASGGY